MDMRSRLGTLHKRQPRIYCLAADTAEEVEKWVHCLLIVLQQIGRKKQGLYTHLFS